jgi:hypothetical protein
MYGPGQLVEYVSGKPKYRVKWYYALVTTLIHIGMALKVVMWRILFNLPLLKEHFIKYMYTFKSKAKQLPLEDFINSMATYKSWVGMSRSATVDAMKTVYEGGPMKDVDLFRLDKTMCRLTDFMLKGRPLVVNFGSCT